MESYIVFILLGLAGLSFFYMGVYILYTDRKIKRRGRKTLATVVDIDEIESKDGATYQLILKFRGRKGEEVTQALGFSSSIKPKKTLPYKIPIYYLEEDNSYKLVLVSNKLKTYVGAFLLLGGSAMLVFCFLHIFDIIDLSI